MQAPCQDKVTLSTWHSNIQVDCDCLEGGRLHDSPVSLFHCCASLNAKKFFFMLKWNFLCFNIWPLCLVLLLHHNTCMKCEEYCCHNFESPTFTMMTNMYCYFRLNWNVQNSVGLSFGADGTPWLQELNAVFMDKFVGSYYFVYFTYVETFSIPRVIYVHTQEMM